MEESRRFTRVIAILLGLMLSAHIPFAVASNKEYVGKVIGIADGDTITILLPEKVQLKVRLAEIDAPERAQAFGDKSKKKLSDLIFEKQVRILQIDKDRYGRAVAKVFLGDLDINSEMVRLGFAWVYEKYASDEKLYTLQDDARKHKRGVWSLPQGELVAPWEYRQMGKRKSAAQYDKEPANDNAIMQNKDVRSSSGSR